MRQKYYYYDKQKGFWICLCHKTKFSTRQEVRVHSEDHRALNGDLTPYEKHRKDLCGKNSRVCRYCHPEKELCTDDLIAHQAYDSKGDKFETLVRLLSLEIRNRHRFKKEHFVQLDRAIKGNRLRSMISTRVLKRLKVKPYNDGK